MAITIPSQVRPPTADPADVLSATPADPCFDLESWNRQWSVVEAELRAMRPSQVVAETFGSEPRVK